MSNDISSPQFQSTPPTTDSKLGKSVSINDFFDDPIEEEFHEVLKMASWRYERAQSVVREAMFLIESQLATAVIHALHRGASQDTIDKMLFWIVMNHPEFHLRQLAELFPGSTLEGLDDKQQQLRELGDRRFRELEILDLKTMPYKEYLQSDHWKRVREYALEDAGNRCRLCNSDKSLHVHHRTYERRGEEMPDDLIVLCAECHQHFHNGRKVTK